MSSGSSTAETAPAPSVTYIARRASPSERSSAARHMPRPSGTAEGNTHCVNPRASVAVSPVAPSRASSLASHGYTRATAPPMNTAMSTREAPAITLAASRSPRPSAREASAVAAIDRPMAREVRKNSNVPA